MRNGHLKPGYNIQIGLDSEYIVNVGSFPDSNDTNTFIPFLTELNKATGKKYANVIADAVYESEENYYENCTDCPYREKRFKSQRFENRQISFSIEMMKYRRQSLQNIASETGIKLRVNRSIQAEGAFGVIKENYAFRRFLTIGKRKTETRFFLIDFAFNILKFHNKRLSDRLKTELFDIQAS